MKGIVLAGNPFLLSNNNTILIASIVVACVNRSLWSNFICCNCEC